jgi:hypothetical protein
MKFDYNENKWELGITLIPETPKEFAELLRISRNAKAEKPVIYFSFSTDTPTCSISLAKVVPEKQTNSINPLDRQNKG